MILIHIGDSRILYVVYYILFFINLLEEGTGETEGDRRWCIIIKKIPEEEIGCNQR